MSERQTRDFSSKTRHGVHPKRSKLRSSKANAVWSMASLGAAIRFGLEVRAFASSHEAQSTGTAAPWHHRLHAFELTWPPGLKDAEVGAMIAGVVVIVIIL